MTNQPLVSIIIPCYNHGNVIMDAVNSALSQSYQNIEIIVINDGSTDKETLESLEDLEKHRKCILLHQNNTGPGIARNNGVEHSNGEYLVFLDADDLILENTIDTAVNILNADKNIGVVYGDHLFFGEKQGLGKQSQVNIRTLLTCNQIAILSILRKEAFKDYGGFDSFTSKYGIEDYEMWLTLSQTKWEFKYIAEVLFKIRVTNDSRTYSMANPHLEKSLSHIYKKHALLLHSEYVKLYHDYKNLKGTIDYKIGNSILKPFRIIKNQKNYLKWKFNKQ